MADPDQATPAPEVVALLGELSRGLQRIAVISGRDTDGLAARLPIDGLIFVGNHGLEERYGDSRLLAAAAPFSSALERAADAVSRLDPARLPGVRVERKRAAVTVHFRNAIDSSAAQAALRRPLERIAADERLRLHAGRMVWELRPALQIGKGQVLHRLAATLQPKAIIYIGDDLTDADAFAALKAMPAIRTVAVGVRSHEVSDATFADCDLTVEGVTGVIELLGELRDLSHSR